MKLKKLAQRIYTLSSRPLKSCWTFPNLSGEIMCVYYENGSRYENAAREIADYISKTYKHEVKVNSIQNVLANHMQEVYAKRGSIKKVGVTHSMVVAFTKAESLVVCGEWLQGQLNISSQELGKNIKLIRPELFNVSLLGSENIKLYFSGMEIDRVIKPVSVVAVLASDIDSWMAAIKLCDCVRETYPDKEIALLFVIDSKDVKSDTYVIRGFLSIFEASRYDEHVSLRIASSITELQKGDMSQTLMVLSQQKSYLTTTMSGALFYVNEAEFRDLWGYGYARQLLLNDIDKLAQYVPDDVRSVDLWRQMRSKHKSVAGWLRKLYWLRRRLDIFYLKIV